LLSSMRTALTQCRLWNMSGLRDTVSLAFLKLIAGFKLLGLVRTQNDTCEFSTGDAVPV
jgi:hypothetical protein